LREFKDGNAVKPLKSISNSKNTGTQINFLPSKEIFSTTKLSLNTVQKRRRELAFLNKGIKILIKDSTLKKIKQVEFKFEGGLLEFVEFLDKERQSLKNKNNKESFKKPIGIEGKKENKDIEGGKKWNTSYTEEVYPYTNNIYQKEGGTHPLGSRSA
jgi:Type IIA topoisomerase (DNA gyrase/topo II, topoisomerase IV), B subunit